MPDRDPRLSGSVVLRDKPATSVAYGPSPSRPSRRTRGCACRVAHLRCARGPSLSPLASTVQGEFARLVKDDPRFDMELRAFLSRTYNLKAIADYQTGSQVTVEQAREAIQTARRLWRAPQVIYYDGL